MDYSANPGRTLKIFGTSVAWRSTVETERKRKKTLYFIVNREY